MTADDSWLLPFSQKTLPVVKGNLGALPAAVRTFIAKNVEVCRPKGLYIVDGSDEEAEEITQKMVARGMLTKLRGENK